MKFLHKISKNLSSNSKRPSLMKWFGRNKQDKDLVQHETEMQKQDTDPRKQAIKESEDEANPYASSTVNLTRREVKALKNQMHFLPNLVTPSNELQWYAKMKVPAKTANTNGYISIALMITGFVIPLFIKEIGSMPTRLLASVAMAFAMWYLVYSNEQKKFNDYSFENELRFNKVITVLDLSQLKRSYSINAILSATAERFRRDKVLSNSISTLSSRIGDDPTSPRPYLEFAHEFSTTQRARLFMMAVYRMAQGHYDDTQIKSIKHSSAQDVTYQSKRLWHKKIARYQKLNLYLFGGFVVYFVVYILFFIGLFVFRSLGSAM